MCTKYYSKLYKDTKKEAIWELWSNVNNWTKWHTGLDYCKLEGEFKTGHYLTLKHKGVGIVRLFLEEVKKEESFTAYSNFFGAKIHYTRSVEEKSEGLLITYTMSITGPLKFWWYLIMKNKLVNCMPHDVDKLVEVANKQNH
jgi:hypothetical protein